ncbi:Vesicle-mediated ER to Golgi transport protein, partial [Tieghemiomyces parasiticus]
GDNNQPQSAQETVRRLADRVAHSTLIEDRRAAILSLKGLAREYKRDVGAEALEPLLMVLEQDREDASIVKPVLETLNHLCARDSRDDPPSLGADHAERLLARREHIAALLDIIEEPDFYVRFNAVQLLATLLACHPTPLQEAVLVLPMGVGRLMDLLNDSREIVRNEALLLLIALTEDSADIQKILAFQGAFERLLDIVAQEGGIRGGIIVQDCLQLLHNLLRYNVSNQNFFRETSNVARLPALLSTEVDNSDTKPYEHEEVFEWTEQAASNAIYLLDTVRLLVAPGSLNTKANQDAIYHGDLFSPLVQLSLAPDTPPGVRSQALFCLGDVIRGNSRNQDLFNRITVTVVPEGMGAAVAEPNKLIPEPVILSILALAVSPADQSTYTVRSAATYLTLSYVYGNPETALTLASTLTPPPDDDPHSGLRGSARSAGSILTGALLAGTEPAARDPFRTWYAAVILGQLLHGNPLCKSLALKVRFGEQDHGEDPVTLLQEITQALVAAVEDPQVDRRVAIGYLMLLCRWVSDSPDSVSQFLEESSSLHFLMEQMALSSAGAADPLVQGLAATLIALIYEFDDDPACPLPRAELEPIIHQRIGADMIISRLHRLRDHKAFQDVSLYMKPTLMDKHTHLPELYFDQGFTDFFRAHYDSLHRAVTSKASDLSRLRQGPIAGSATAASRDAEVGRAVDPEVIRGYEVQIQELETLVAEQTAQLESMAAQLTTAQRAQNQGHGATEARVTQLAQQLQGVQVSSDAPDTDLIAKVHELEAALAAAEVRAANVEKEQEDLLVYLADQDTQAAEYRRRLRELGEDIPPSDDEVDLEDLDEDLELDEEQGSLDDEEGVVVVGEGVSEKAYSTLNVSYDELTGQRKAESKSTDDAASSSDLV